MINYDALIFDLDGTLWNACQTTANGWNAALHQLGIQQEVTAAQIANVTGIPYKEALEITLPGLSNLHPSLSDTIKYVTMDILSVEGGTLYPGVAEGVERLADHYSLFIVSNCQERYLQLFFQFSGLHHFFKGFDCNGISGSGKDEMLINMKNNNSLKHPVYIGDMIHDQQAAKKAGMDFIHVSYGFDPLIDHPRSYSTFHGLVNYLMD